MKKLLIFTLAVFFSLVSTSWALFFEGVYPDGSDSAPVSAELSYLFSGDVLTITIDNTSPTETLFGASNAPAITDFGFNTEFNLGSATLTLATAWIIPDPYQYTGSSFFSSIEVDITTLWALDDYAKMNGTGGTTLDLLATTSGIEGGIVNPAITPSTGSYLYWSSATFTIAVDQSPGALTDWNLRFQNVGKDGEGSIVVDPVPEPATMLLFGTGLVSLAGSRLRRKKK